MKDMRFSRGGPLTSWMTRTIGTHAYLNVRTYVKNEEAPSIYFITEWLPNRIATALGPLTFGLPYRFGRIDYRHDHEQGQLSGSVGSGCGSELLSYTASMPAQQSYAAPEADTLTEFLMERYVAYTSAGSSKKKFRVWHEPWEQVAVEAVVDDRGLLDFSGDWVRSAKLIGANYSPGLRDVRMSRPV
jgi:uncharacterized protein YqjF (DUF2071 family)